MTVGPALAAGSGARPRAAGVGAVRRRHESSCDVDVAVALRPVGVVPLTAPARDDATTCAP
jgi:hypothetical protein